MVIDKELIFKNATTLETAARDSLGEANAQVFKISDLLVKIAFAVGGLAATRIVSSAGNPRLDFSRWGLVFLGASVVSGSIQMLSDRAYFRKHGFLLVEAADAWKLYGANSEDPEAVSNAQKTLNKLSTLPKTSSEWALYVQIALVALGVVFSLIDVFIIRTRA
jgi:hypothetical protein